jgi:hypothetical protein
MNECFYQIFTPTDIINKEEILKVFQSLSINEKCELSNELLKILSIDQNFGKIITDPIFKQMEVLIKKAKDLFLNTTNPYKIRIKII